MPYTREWIDNTPLGSTAADDIDNAFRNLRLDIAERMDDLTAVGGKWSANDPVSLTTTPNTIQSSRRYNYNSNVLAGMRATNEANIQTLLAFQLVGVMTNGASQIIINFADLGEVYDLDDINYLSLVRGIVIDTTAGTRDFVFLLRVNVNVVAKTITYSVRKANGGLVVFHALNGIILFYQNTRPEPLP